MNSFETKQGLKTFLITSAITLGVIFSLNLVSNYYNIQSENVVEDSKTALNKYSKIQETPRLPKIEADKTLPSNVFANLTKEMKVLGEATQSATPSGEASPAAPPETGISIYGLAVIIFSILSLFFGFIMLKEMPFRKRLLKKFEEDVIRGYKDL